MKLAKGKRSTHFFLVGVHVNTICKNAICQSFFNKHFTLHCFVAQAIKYVHPMKVCPQVQRVL